MGTETDKVGYFEKLEVFGRKLRDDDFPRVVFGTGDRRTTRYFPDKLPIGISPEYGHRLVFVFLVMHEVGAHYTYSKVPYDAWSQSLSGGTINGLFGFRRNHYDRLVHFMYGFLLAYPMREVFVRVAGARGFWGYCLPLMMTMATSCLYELVEWGAALVVGADMGNAYLGTQGDELDAQQDMALASLGALVSLAIVFAIHRRLARDFHAEWAESLRIKRKQPLGEQAVAEHRRGT
jgi:putative membrane protein